MFNCSMDSVQERAAVYQLNGSESGLLIVLKFKFRINIVQNWDVQRTALYKVCTTNRFEHKMLHFTSTSCIVANC